LKKVLAAVLLTAVVCVMAVSAASAQGTAQKVTTVKLGVYPSVDYAPLFVGLKRGLFKKHGLDIKITYLYTGSGLMAAATSGQVDLATNSVTAGVNAIIQGLPLKMVTATDYSPRKGNTEVLVKSDSPIKGWKDLEGKTVATVNLQGLFHLGVLGAVGKAGGDTASVKSIPMSPVDEPNALLAGRLDAIVLQDPFLSQAKAQGGFRSLGNPYAAISYKVPAGAFYASDSTISSNPAMLKSFVAAWKEAANLSVKNPTLARQTVAKYTGITGPILSKITLPDFAAGMPASALGPMLASMKAYGWIKVVPSYDKLVWNP